MSVRDNDWIFRLFPWFFGITFVCIIVYYISLAVIGVKVIGAVGEECKDGFAKCLGRQVKQFQEGMNEPAK